MRRGSSQRSAHASGVQGDSRQSQGSDAASTERDAYGLPMVSHASLVSTARSTAADAAGGAPLSSSSTAAAGSHHPTTVGFGRAAQAHTLVIGLDEHAATVTLAGAGDWQRVTVTPADFLDAARRPLAGWQGIRELRLGPRETLKGKVDGKPVTRTVGGAWVGAAPEFRHLGWEAPAGSH